MKNKAIAPAMRGIPTPTPTPMPIFEELLRPPDVESFVIPCVDGFSEADAPDGCDTEVETCGLSVFAAPAVFVLPPVAALPPPPPFAALLCVVDAADPVVAVEAALFDFVLGVVVDVDLQPNSPARQLPKFGAWPNAAVLNKARSHTITTDLNILGAKIDSERA